MSGVIIGLGTHIKVTRGLYGVNYKAGADNPLADGRYEKLTIHLVQAGGFAVWIEQLKK